jgi:hypothetical protein
MVCVEGECADACAPDGLTACGDRCVDTTTDRLHCGACDRACSPGERCAAAADADGGVATCVR